MALKVKEEPKNDDDIGPRPSGSESVVAVNKEPARYWVRQEFDELEGRLQGAKASTTRSRILLQGLAKKPTSKDQ